MVCRYYLIFIILWCVGIILYLLSYGVQVLSYIYYLVVCRYYVLYKIPSLTFLDSRAVSARERADAKMKGQFTRVVKPEAAMVSGSARGWVR